MIQVTCKIDSHYILIRSILIVTKIKMSDALQPAIKQSTVQRSYCFTYNLPDGTETWTPGEPLSNKVRYVIWQLERAPTTNQLHVQGYVEFKNATRVAGAQRALGLPNTAHFEMRRGTREQARNYCKKDDTRLEGTAWSEKGEWILERGENGGVKKKARLQALRDLVLSDDVVKDVTKHEASFKLEWIDVYNNCPRGWAAIFEELSKRRMIAEPNIELRPWQVEIIDILRTSPERRRIFWIWSAASGTGKTTFLEYLSLNNEFKEQTLSCPLALKELLFLFEPGKHRILYLNLPRDYQEEKLKDSYLPLLERLSDGGMMTSTKYEPRSKFMRCHIIVTANNPPPYDRLPLRFIEYCLDDN
ncbi:DNA-dependent RNA polymerase beta' subunit/160 kD subunit [Giardia duodenalis]|uniref:DNA-dependent RNA polymerase beta' subunit/160 kD subunit n=2 Tax=Giardia intestinalis TaxID=5741 RepID=V6TR85_GIAIN|nr:DNA-dependent RNA polymerase beta' subunit/160 kD subunit [Giardia intestinalis]